MSEDASKQDKNKLASIDNEVIATNNITHPQPQEAVSGPLKQPAAPTSVNINYTIMLIYSSLQLLYTYTYLVGHEFPNLLYFSL